MVGLAWEGLAPPHLDQPPQIGVAPTEGMIHMAQSLEDRMRTYKQVMCLLNELSDDPRDWWRDAGWLADVFAEDRCVRDLALVEIVRSRDAQRERYVSHLAILFGLSPDQTHVHLGGVLGAVIYCLGDDYRAAALRTVKPYADCHTLSALVADSAVMGIPSHMVREVFLGSRDLVLERMRADAYDHVEVTA
jgi:hypothetical protein